GVSTMQMQRILAAGCFLVLMLGAPALANAERSCISTVAGDTCLAQCIGNLQLDCGSHPACHQAVAAAIQMLASAPVGTDMCEAAVDTPRCVGECAYRPYSCGPPGVIPQPSCKRVGSAR